MEHLEKSSLQSLKFSDAQAYHAKQGTQISLLQKFNDVIQWALFPIKFILAFIFCCTVKSRDSEMVAKIKKHLKRDKHVEEFKSINAMVQLLQKSPNAIKQLETIRINP